MHASLGWTNGGSQWGFLGIIEIRMHIDPDIGDEKQVFVLGRLVEVGEIRKERLQEFFWKALAASLMFHYALAVSSTVARSVRDRHFGIQAWRSNARISYLGYGTIKRSACPGSFVLRGPWYSEKALARMKSAFRLKRRVE